MNTPYKMKGPSLLKMVSALKSKPTKDKVKKNKTTGVRKRGGFSTNVDRTQNTRGTNTFKKSTSKKSTLTGVVGGKKVTLNSEQLKNIGVE